MSDVPSISTPRLPAEKSLQSESKKLIVSGSSAKIPIQIKRLDSDRVVIERNAFLNHTLYRNKKEAWVIDFVSLIAMPLYEGFPDNIDGESLVPFFVKFDDAISVVRRKDVYYA